MDFSQNAFYSRLPFKSVGLSLLLSVILGPIGLLYASFWGGVTMILVGFVVLCNKLTVPIMLTWVICCIWAVGATNRYNKKLLTDRK